MTRRTLVATSPWTTFAICSTAAYMTALDLSVVNVAFPEILREFSTNRADLSWIVTIYSIFFAGLLIVAGKAADQFGRRRMFIGGFTVFGLGSVVWAASNGLPVLIIGRAVQGIGGAMLGPAALGLLLAAFTPERRTTVVALFGAIGALGIASGPGLGSILISLTDWRAAFWVNIPIVVILVLASSRLLRESDVDPDATSPDLIGATLITVALAALALGLSRSDVWGWTDPRTLASLLVALVSAPLFWRRQRVHPNPIVDLALFEDRAFTVANLSGVAFFAGFGASSLNNVLFLRQVWGYSVLRAGLISTLAPLTVAIFARFAAGLASRHGFRPFVAAGPAIVALSALAMRLTLDASPAPWTFIALGEILAIGVVLFIPVNTAAAVANLPPARLSIGAAVNNTARQVGAVIGIAALVAVLGFPETPAELLASSHRGYILIAVVTGTASAIGLAQTKAPHSPASA